MPYNPPPPKMTERRFITDQCLTGLSTVDLLVPLAKGQRQMVIGDARSGKTSFLIDTVVNQKKDLICIFALIGKPVVEIRRIMDVLSTNKAMDNTVIVASSSSDLASLIYVTPQAAMTVAEYFRAQGNDVLIILDDLGIHAKYYREMALLQNQAPGREAYPGDIFYQHAKLLERAGNFNDTVGGKSITALPVIEINLDNLTNFIPTNLMAMTDGHLIFDSRLYHQGQRPAIDVGLSVSRVGRQTQGLVQKQLSDKIKATLSEADRLEAFARLGNDLSDQTKATLLQKKQIISLLTQQPLAGMPLMVQMMLLALVFSPLLAQKPMEYIVVNKIPLIQFLSTKVDLKYVQTELEKMTDLSQFITLVTTLTKSLDKGATR